MSSFRSALAVARAHPVYLLVYLVLLSLLGVFLVLGDALSADGGADAGAEDYEARVAVIDRDESELSGALAGYLGGRFELAEIADEGYTLQDALATSAVDCVLIVPAGTQEALLAAGRAGDDAELPELEAAWGTRPAAGSLVSQEAARWMSLATQAAALEPAAGVARVAELADAAANARGEVSVLETGGEPTTGTDLFLMYLKFCSYSLCCTVTVCAGVVLAAFSRPEVRRRLAVGPVPAARRAAGALAACGVLTVAAWAWLVAVGLVACRSLLAGTDAGAIAGAALCLLAFALVPLALAFALAQMGAREDALNAVGNIGGMLMAFLAGAWVPLDLMGDAVQAASRLTPAYWAYDAMETVLAGTPGAAGRIASDLGLVTLFAAALACVGFAAGRVRLRSRAA